MFLRFRLPFFLLFGVSLALSQKDDILPGMPPVLNPADIYSEDHAGKLSPVVKNFPSRVYVPNSASNTVDIIDPATFKIVGHFDVGKQPQHVVHLGFEDPVGVERLGR